MNTLSSKNSQWDSDFSSSRSYRICVQNIFFGAIDFRTQDGCFNAKTRVTRRRDGLQRAGEIQVRHERFDGLPRRASLPIAVRPPISTTFQQLFHFPRATNSTTKRNNWGDDGLPDY
jgi:hypothetical protein